MNDYAPILPNPSPREDFTGEQLRAAYSAALEQDNA